MHNSHQSRIIINVGNNTKYIIIFMDYIITYNFSIKLK